MDGMKLIVFGTLGRDPESKYTPAGKMVTTASAAVNIGKGDYKKTEWIKITLWGDSAEAFGRMTQKGTSLYLEGLPKVETWKSKDGEEAKGQINLTVFEWRILKNGRPKEDAEESDNPYEGEQ